MPFKKVFPIIFTFLSFSTTAQDYSHEFGVLTDYEKNMTIYEKDSTAEAVIIYDIGESSFYFVGGSSKIRYERRIKIKVLKESYIDKSDGSIPLFKGKGLNKNSTKVEGVTYNSENGEIIKSELKKENLFEEKIYDDYYSLKFAMPKVKVGSVIELKIVIKDLKSIQDWYFQRTIPIIYSEYVAKMVPFYEYKIRLQGASRLDDQKVYKEPGPYLEFYGVTYKNLIHQYIMEDIPAFKDESFISSRENYIIKLDFQLSKVNYYGGTTTDILSSWYLLRKKLITDDDFLGYSKKSKFKFKKIADENNLMVKNEKDKTDFILNYLKQNFNWNGWNSMFTTKTLNSFLKEKTGNSAQFNLYLVGALKAVNIEAYPVILSTRENGKIIRQYPFLDPFNYVLAYAKINGNWKLLDATDTYCPNDKIPEKCINDIGLIINKKEIKWVKIMRRDIALIQNNFKSKLSADLDTLIGKVDIQSNGYSAIKLRKDFKNNTQDLEDYISEDEFEITSPVTTQNYNEINKAYIINYDLNCLTERINDKIIIHPFFNDPHQDNPLKEESRKYPIDMVYPKSVSYKNEIQIPDNCLIEKLPEETFINNDLFLLQYSANENNGIISLNATYQFKKAIYQPEEYLKIKSYFDLIIKYFNQNIVLVEKPD